MSTIVLLRTKSRILTLCLAVALVVFCSGFGKQQNDKGESQKLKVGFITNGPVNDWGYNYAHNLGRIEMENALKGKVETFVVENVPESADAERVIERMIKSGTGLVVATSFGYQDAVYKLAGKYPQVKFAQAWGFKSKPNMVSYSAKMYEVWYVMGILAGSMTKSNKLGVVAAHPIPPMKWQINAYVLGALSVNPKITVSVVFINHWFDASLASDATNSLIEQGADVLTGVLDNSVAVVQTAEKKHAYVVGHNVDLTRFAPHHILSSTEWLWGNLYTNIAKDVLAKTPLNGKHYTGGFREHYVGYSNFNSIVPPEVQEAAQEAADMIRLGKLSVYAGPIRDNKDKLQVEPGKVLNHDEIMAIDWLVQGVR